MKDKFIMGFLIFTLWVFIGTIWLIPNSASAQFAEEYHNHFGEYAEHTHFHNTYNIHSFKREIKKIVENCNAEGGYIDGGLIFGISINCF